MVKDTEMKTLNRIKNIINSNVNSTLDKIENPEKIISLMISDLENTLDKVKRSMRSRKAEKKSLEKDIEDAIKKEQRWLDRAKMAVQNGRDDLAKEALAEQKEVKSQIKQMKERVISIDSILMSEDESLQELTEKLREIKEKKASLVNRANHAKSKQAVKETLKEANGDEIEKRFNDLEAKIEQMEEENNIKQQDLNDEFENMEMKAEIDKELEELKKSMEPSTDDGKVEDSEIKFKGNN
jgi:phage shock protein A